MNMLCREGWCYALRVLVAAKHLSDCGPLDWPGEVIVGKDAEIDLLLVALLCEGHVLIEDVPGVGKTMLAKSLARSLGCTFQRIQKEKESAKSCAVSVNTSRSPTCSQSFKPRMY